MLKLSNMDVAETLRAFSAAGVECTFIVPTSTGLEKSILDATDTVRIWLKENRFHDYELQQQGQPYKILIDTLLISRGETVETTTSLYRPETKSGDPRMWVARLKQHAAPTDLLALCNIGRKLLVINCSQNNIFNLLKDKKSIFWGAHNHDAAHDQQVYALSSKDISEILHDESNSYVFNANKDTSLAAQDLHTSLEQGSAEATKILQIGDKEITIEALELLGMLKKIGLAGYQKTQRIGDTGVGFTLETLLGIKCNNSKAPDFKGVEIKAGRAASHGSGRTTIFSQVPDWSISRLKGSADILRERGRFHEAKQRMQLFHEMSAKKINSYGLSLKVDDGGDFLHQTFSAVEREPVIDVTWRMLKLFERLIEKHRQTFWVKAEIQGKGKFEEFHYSSARYTSGVSQSKLPILLESGVVSVDYTIKGIAKGGAKDQGYLFKIRQSDLPLLFKAPIEFDLTAS